jgi:hypothetical protein
MATKKALQVLFALLIREPRSGMDKNQVQDKHLGSATLQKNVKKLSKISL